MSRKGFEVYNVYSDRGILILAILLIVVITVLFVYFSFSLLNILKNLTSEGNVEIPFKNELDLKNASILNKMGFDIKQLIEFESPKFELLLVGESPYTSLRLSRNYGIHNLFILVTLEHNRNLVNVGLFLGKTDQCIDIEVDENYAVEIYHFIKNSQPTAYFSIFNENFHYSFTGIIKRESETNDGAETVKISLDQPCDYRPPKQIIKELTETKKTILEIESKKF